MQLQSQARLGGLGGFSGYDFSSLSLLLEINGVPRCDWWEYVMKLTVLSEVAVSIFNKKSEDSD